MHLEIREKSGIKKYYLSHSYRIGGKVRKARIYIGENLAGAELEIRKKLAEEKLRHKLEAVKKISDPFKTVLSKSELSVLGGLETKVLVKIARLSEADWERFSERFTYDTNAIEGSAIGQKEVANILERGKWPDKPKGDISETYGVANAIKHIRKCKEHISLPLILELHRIVFENSKPFAGKLRARGIEVVVADGQGNVVHRGAPSTSVRSLLLELCEWYGKNKSKYSPLVLAAVVHNQFENIHPFQDGNGRVGRLLLNNILLRHNMPPLNIELERRFEYYSALQAYEKMHNLRPTIELFLTEYKAMKKMLKR